MQGWVQGVLHDFRLVPGFKMLSLLVALLHTDPFGDYELFFRQFMGTTPVIDQTQPANRRVREIRLAEPLSHFLAFVWGFPTDQGKWNPDSDADRKTAKDLFRSLSDSSETLLDSLLARGNRFGLAHTVGLPADGDWAREIRRRMTYNCPDDIATIFLLSGVTAAGNVDVLWRLMATPGRPHVYNLGKHKDVDQVQDIEPIWMIGAKYCCFCYEVIWFVHLVEAIKSTDQATIIPALFRFLL
jgi:hypothetical protein